MVCIRGDFVWRYYPHERVVSEEEMLAADVVGPRRQGDSKAGREYIDEIYGSSGKSVLFPSDSTTVGYVEDFLRHDSGVRWFLVRSSYQSVL